MDNPKAVALRENQFLSKTILYISWEFPSEYFGHPYKFWKAIYDE